MTEETGVVLCRARRAIYFGASGEAYISDTVNNLKLGTPDMIIVTLKT